MLIITIDPQLRYHPSPLAPPGALGPPPPPEPDKVLSIQAWDTESGARWQMAAHTGGGSEQFIMDILEKWWAELLKFPEVPQWPR